MTESKEEAEERIQRSTSIFLSIDPGFFHLEMIQQIIGEQGQHAVDEYIAQLPVTTPDFLKETYTRQRYTLQAMSFCYQNKIQSLHAAVLDIDTEYFSGPIQVDPYKEELNGRRLVSNVIIQNSELPPIRLKYSENRIVADTIRSKLANGALVRRSAD